MQSRETLIHEFCCGIQPAIDFFLLIANISQVWDDLIDKDNQQSDDQINLMMWQALIELNENPFFAQNIQQLLPVMKKAIVNWLTSNQHEAAGDKEMLKVSYIKRSCVTDIAIFVALLCGGLEHSLRYAPLIEAAVFKDDSFDDYLNEQLGGSDGVL